MSKWLVLLMACSLIVGGCGMLESVGENPVGAEGSESAAKEDFQGHYIQVWVDGTETKNSGKQIMGDLVWDGPADSSGNPEIKFTLDAAKLGDFKGVEIVINPMNGETVDFASIIKPKDTAEMKPDTPFAIGSSAGFDQIANGAVETPAAIPAGNYRLSFTVHGTTSWDRQSIPLVVK